MSKPSWKFCLLLILCVAGCIRQAEAGIPPRHVVSVQGPTDPAHLYVWITWDFSDPAAVGYEILRDGKSIATVDARQGGRWAGCAWQDKTVEASKTYSYQVGALFPDHSKSEPSAACRISVRSDSSLGRIYPVDDYPGTDLEKSQAAIAAARKTGGVVRFGPRTYTFDKPLLISRTNNVVLRGAGPDRTILQPGFAGDSDPCGQGGALITFRGNNSDKPDCKLAEPVEPGSRKAHFSSTTGLKPGQVIFFKENARGNPRTFQKDNVIHNPATGRDESGRVDSNPIVSVDGGIVTFKYPWSHSFPVTSVVRRLGEPGSGNGIELLTVQGLGATDETYYTLVDLDSQVNFHCADVTGRWANRHYLSAGSSHGVQVVGFRGEQGGAANWTTGICKYKISIHSTSNFIFVAGVLGEPENDLNQSFVTIQQSQRALVRHSRFYGSRTYALNEHGGGSRGYLFENNLIQTGSTARFGGVLLGNDSWGYAGPGIIRNNLFVNNRRDLYSTENSYGVRFLDNISRGNTECVVQCYGWAETRDATFSPIGNPDLYGSLQMTVRGNVIEQAKGDGIILGGLHNGVSSPFYGWQNKEPFLGVKDVLIDNNRFDVKGEAIKIFGTPDQSKRISITNNTGTTQTNSTGAAPAITWDTPCFDWELGPQ